MQTPDFLIIAAFLLGTTLFGILQGRSNRSSGDYFLGGRNIPWIVAMFSIVATETSVLTFVSIPGIAYRGDWSFLQLALGYILGRVLVSIFLLPAYFREGITSIYEVIGKRFGKNIQKLASATFLLTRILADGVRFLATAVIVQAVTGWPLSISVLVIGIVTLTYTLAGGIKTVVWMDSIQFILYLGGGIITIVFLLAQLDMEPLQAMTLLQETGKLAVINPDLHILTNPWAFASAVIGGALLSLSSHGVDHMMVQRALGCRNLGNARKAMIGSGIFVFIQFSVFLLAGSLIFLFEGGRELPKDRELALFIVENLPVGLKGILLAGVLSAAMSTLSSSINALASSTVTDFLGGGQTLRKSRQVSFAWAALLIAIALVFDESQHAIVILGLQIASFTYGGLLSLFLLSKSRKEFHPSSLAAGLITGMIGVYLLTFTPLAWTWYISSGLVLNLATVLVTEYVRSLRR